MNHRDTETEGNELNGLSAKVIGFCISIHRELGPGLLESVYEEALAYELKTGGVEFTRQEEIAVRYREVVLPCAFRADFIIGKALIVELKAVSDVLPIHEAQLLTYMRLRHLSLGLLVNFNVAYLKGGIKRFALGQLFR